MSDLSTATTLVDTATTIELHYTKDNSLSDVSYEVQATTNLQEFSAVGVIDSLDGPANPSGLEERKASVPIDGSFGALRLKITMPQSIRGMDGGRGGQPFSLRISRMRSRSCLDLVSNRRSSSDLSDCQYGSGRGEAGGMHESFAFPQSESKCTASTSSTDRPNKVLGAFTGRSS